MNAVLYALLLAGAAFAGSHELTGPGWSAELKPDSRTLRVGRDLVRMNLAGANPTPSLSELRGRVRYSEVYEGIHLDYYRVAGSLEYDFVVAAGAEPARIAMTFPGIGALVIDEQGELLTGGIRHRAPIAYQMKQGKLAAVKARFVLRPEGVGFELGEYDRSQPLVIDPVIVSSSTIGGVFEGVLSYAKDAAGNQYVGSYSIPGNASMLRKVNAAGAVLSSTVLPIDNGVNTSFPPAFFADFHLALDSAQNIYIGSQSKSCPANATRIIGAAPQVPGTFLLIMKLLPDAATISYLTCVQLDRNNRIQDITVDAAGNAYIVGSTEALVFPATSTFGPILTGLSHGFVTKVDPTGQSFTFSIVFGSGTEATSVVRDDTTGNLLVGGLTGPDFQTVSPMQPTFGGGAKDGFLMKVRADGLQVLNATFLGGSGDDAIRDVLLHSSGQPLVGGETASANFPKVGNDSAACVGPDGFVSRFDANLASLTLSTCFPDSNPVKFTSLALASGGHIFAGGTMSSAMLVAKFASGGKLQYSLSLTQGSTPAVIPTADGFLTAVSTFMTGAAQVQAWQERADLGVTVTSSSAAVRNFGPDPALGVGLEVTMTTGTLTTTTAGCGAITTRRIVCKVGTVLNGATVPVTFTAAGGTPRATVTSSTVDLNPANNTN